MENRKPTADEELARVNWGPDPNAPPINALAYRDGQEPEAAATVRQDLARVAFQYGVLGSGQDPNKAQGWKPQARRWARLLKDPRTLDNYATMTVGNAYIYDEMWTKARTDGLTGLPNRKRWVEDLERGFNWVNDPSGGVGSEVERGEEMSECSILLCFVDLDGFKLVNDVFKHETGNLVLKLFAERYERIARGKGRGAVPPDLVARLHGDEFVSNHRIYIPRTAGQADKRSREEIQQEITERAGAIVKRIQESMREEIAFINLDLAEISRRKGCETPVQIGYSMGWHLLHPGDTIEDFIEGADAAMYEAKNRRKEEAAEEDRRNLTAEEMDYLRNAAEALKRFPRQVRLAAGIGSLLGEQIIEPARR